jgi:alpha-1,6-mannosyltransferase
MKICDIVQSFTARSGGIRTYIQAKRRHLAATGRHPHVLVMPGREDRVHVEADSTVYEVASPYVPGYRPYRFNLRLDRVVRLLARERPDVIELASPYLMPWAAFHHRRRHRCAVVAYYHADFPVAYVGAPVASVWGRTAGELARRVAESYARRVHEACDLTVTASPTYHARLRHMGIQRVEEVPLGVDLELFHPRRARREVWDTIFPGTGRGPVLAYCGRLDREKQVEVIVAAFRRLPTGLGARLFMMGEGPLRPRLQALAADDPRFAVHEFEPDRRRLAELLASADLYVTAGPYETFGLSVIEAQASGLPVVGVAAGALVDRVPPGLGALVPAGDPPAMAAAIADQLACDPRARGLAARDWVARESSWATVFDRLVDLYRGCRPLVATSAEAPAMRAAAGSADP